MNSMKPDIEMSDHQDAELWKDLFDEDSDMLSSDIPSEQRKSSSPNSSWNGTSAEHLNSDKQEIWSAKLARMYPALMISTTFLQLITRYTNKEIISWISRGMEEPPISYCQLHGFKEKALSILSEQYVGGEEMLKPALDVAREHHRGHREPHREPSRSRIGTLSIHDNMDAWYAEIDKPLPADLQNLPLFHYACKKKTLREIKASAGAQALKPLSSLLRELLFDPLFSFRSLDEIPCALFLELCTTHSYGHLADKLLINNPDVQSTRQDVSDHAQTLLQERFNAFREREMLSKAAMASSSPEYYKICTKCSADGCKNCKSRVQITANRIHLRRREPDEQCTRCTELGVACTNLAKRTKRVVESELPATTIKCGACVRRNTACRGGSSIAKCTCCISSNTICSIATEHPDGFRHRQKHQGHAYEQKLDITRFFDPSRRDLFPRLYALLGELSAFQKKHNTRSSTLLCLPPPPKMDEKELHALVRRFREPKVASPTQTEQSASPPSAFEDEKERDIQSAEITTPPNTSYDDKQKCVQTAQLSTPPVKSEDLMEEESDDDLDAQATQLCELWDRNQAMDIAEGAGSPMHLSDSEGR